jgi:complement component 1 Q subcomponent-binding protein
VIFSTADVNNDAFPEEPYPEEDAEEGAEDGEPVPNPYPSEAQPVGITLEVTRQGREGALLIEASVSNGSVVLEEFYYLKGAELAQPKTFEAEKTRSELYPGPSFNNLDEDLQDLLYNYVAEWGVNEELALFVVEYIEHKEQKDYVKWLTGKFP